MGGRKAVTRQLSKRTILDARGDDDAVARVELLHQEERLLPPLHLQLHHQAAAPRHHKMDIRDVQHLWCPSRYATAHVAGLVCRRAFE